MMSLLLAKGFTGSTQQDQALTGICCRWSFACAAVGCFQVDLLFKQHQDMLKALYSRYRLKPSGGGLRPKVLRLDGWLAMMAVSRGLLSSVGGIVESGQSRRGSAATSSAATSA